MTLETTMAELGVETLRAEVSAAHVDVQKSALSARRFAPRLPSPPPTLLSDDALLRLETSSLLATCVPISSSYHSIGPLQIGHVSFSLLHFSMHLPCMGTLLTPQLR